MIPGIVASGGGGDAGPADPLYASVASLLHFDGADGATTFTDQKGVAWTPAGNAQLDTAQARFGDASLLLDGTGDWLQATTANFGFGTTDFCIECWARWSVLSGNRFIFSFGGGWGLYAFGTQLAVFDGVASNVIIVGGLVVNTWYHFALCRAGTALRLFSNGVLIGNVSNTTNFTNSTIRIGAQPSGSGAMAGHVDDFRVTKAARYVSAFTPPTAAFPNH